MRSVHYRILRSHKDTPHGPSDRIRTCGILLPNNVKRFFLVIYSAFPCFLVGFRCSLGICKSAFHRCSSAVCGHLCGQKRFPPKTGGFAPAQDGKRFRGSVGHIVTLSGGLCKSFLRSAQLKVCGAINKEIKYLLPSAITMRAPNSVKTKNRADL